MNVAHLDKTEATRIYRAFGKAMRELDETSRAIYAAAGDLETAEQAQIDEALAQLKPIREQLRSMRAVLFMHIRNT